jgi:hypothetical protein
MKKILLTVFSAVIIGSIFYSCSKTENTPATGAPASAQSANVITSLDLMQGTSAMWLKDGKYIRVERVADEDMESERESVNVNRTASCSDNFSGSARANAKTTYSTASTVSYTTIPALRATMQTDTYMHTLGITNSSTRVTAEKRNVSVTTAYLYAIKRESDNDYHMIIGNSTDSTQLLNCESSGLPSHSYSSYNTIKAVRTYLKSYFGTDFCGVTSYTKFTPPLPITILKGSLFYDIDHAPGTIGPAGLRPNTSWEIHPLNSIHF